MTGGIDRSVERFGMRDCCSFYHLSGVGTVTAMSDLWKEKPWGASLWGEEEVYEVMRAGTAKCRLTSSSRSIRVEKVDG